VARGQPPLRLQLGADEADRHDSELRGRPQQPVTRPVPRVVVLERDLAEPRECIAHVRRVVNRQAAFAVRIDVCEGAVGKLRAVLGAKRRHALIIASQIPKPERAEMSESPARETSGGDDRRLDFRPGMGMWWEITRSTEDTSGQLFEATNWIEPRMPGPPVHVHPTAEESYEVVEGALEVFVNGQWSPVRAGEKATVPAGEPHSVRNASDEPARIVNIHQPAQRFESFFRDMHRLIHEDKIRRLPPKDPRSAIYVAMLFGSYPDEIRTVKPPNQVFQSLALIGKALRFRL